MRQTDDAVPGASLIHLSYKPNCSRFEAFSRISLCIRSRMRIKVHIYHFTFWTLSVIISACTRVCCIHRSNQPDSPSAVFPNILSIPIMSCRILMFPPQ